MSHYLWENAWFKIKLNNDKEVFFITGNESLTPIANGITGRSHDGPVFLTYHNFMKAWSMVGLYPVAITNTPLGPLSTPTWYSERFDCQAALKAIYWRDCSEHGEEGSETVWQLKLTGSTTPTGRALYENMPLLREAYDDFLCHGLWDYGVATATPQSNYSPTGRMFCTFLTKFHGHRALVKNTWTRDV